MLGLCAWFAFQVILINKQQSLRNTEFRLNREAAWRQGSQLAGHCSQLGWGNTGTGEAVGADEITTSGSLEREWSLVWFSSHLAHWLHTPSWTPHWVSRAPLSQFSWLLLLSLLGRFSSLKAAHWSVLNSLGPLPFILILIIILLSILLKLLRTVVLNTIFMQMAPKLLPAAQTSLWTSDLDF